MKKIILMLTLAIVVTSCGKKNNNVTSAPQISGAEGLVVSNVVSFTGQYQILRAESNDCSNQFRIVNFCNGVVIKNNGLNADEEFCNVNRGVFRGVDYGTRKDERNQHNPDRNQETQLVTLNGNKLTSVLRISDRISFTNTLTLEENGLLTKVSNLKSRVSRCTYQKI